MVFYSNCATLIHKPHPLSDLGCWSFPFARNSMNRSQHEKNVRTPAASSLLASLLHIVSQQRSHATWQHYHPCIHVGAFMWHPQHESVPCTPCTYPGMWRNPIATIFSMLLLPRHIITSQLPLMKASIQCCFIFLFKVASSPTLFIRVPSSFSFFPLRAWSPF